MSQSLLSRFWPALRLALTLLRATLAPLDTLDRRERAHVRAWLRALEGLARKAVLIAARAVTLSDAPARPRPNTATPAAPRAGKRLPRLRLWPKLRRGRARVRQIGPPLLVREIWRERARAARAAQLAKARLERKPFHIRFADRLDALERLIENPAPAARRLARKLAQAPKIALKIVAARFGEARGVATEIAHAIDRESFYGPAARPAPNSS
ncbi:MAG: hypothetical protein AB7F85_09430 [Hyphomonadaceae bacterium]